MRDITHKNRKMNYTKNVLVIRHVFGTIEKNMGLNETLGTRPLLAMISHTHTKKCTMSRNSNRSCRSCRHTNSHHVPYAAGNTTTYLPQKKQHMKITRKVRCTNRRNTST
jgi:hypothetical protein